jgi:hypothetical protein
MRQHNALKNSFQTMSNNNRRHTNEEISRLGSIEQRNTSYRRNGMLNFGATQLFGNAMRLDYYTIGVGGPTIVG